MHSPRSDAPSQQYVRVQTRTFALNKLASLEAVS